MPLLLFVVDELADVIAYQTDKNLRERQHERSRRSPRRGGPGVCVLGRLQDPRQEITAFWHLFSTRIAMRLDEPAHEISDTSPGAAPTSAEVFAFRLIT